MVRVPLVYLTDARFWCRSISNFTKDNKALQDKSLESRRGLLESDYSTLLATAEKIVTVMNPFIPQAMNDALKYVDSCNAAAIDPLENIEAAEDPGMESSELSKVDENRSGVLSKTNANKPLIKD